MKKVFSLILVLILVLAITAPALADNNIVLNNTGTSILTIAKDEWQGDETYWLVQVHTGVSTTRTYQITIPEGFTSIVECNILNNIGEGHLVAYAGGQTVNIKVTNGFVGLCVDEAAKRLFTERWKVLVENDWARKDVCPIPSWDWTK